MDPQREHNIKVLAEKNGITQEEELRLFIQSINENNHEIQETFSKKKWTQIRNEVNKPKVKKSLLFFRHKLDPSVVKNTSPVLKGIIMGPCGNGKTTLINNLCGTELSAGLATESLTRDVTEVKCMYNYDLPLVFYDSPGTTALKAKLDHAVHLKQLLEFKPVNTVFILIRFIDRIDELLVELSKQSKMLGDFPNIVFLISHIDILKSDEERQTAINLVDRLMIETEMDNQVVFLSNTLIDTQDLADSLYIICKSMPQRQLKIDLVTFHKHFNMKKEESQELFFKKCEKDLLKEMEDITQEYKDYALTFKHDSDRDCIFQDLQIALKNDLVEILGEFQEKYKETMLVTEYYTTYYTIQLTINEKVKKLEETIRSFHTHDLFESQFRGQIDIRDLIKKCPNCSLIWFRIQACPGATCGNRPSCAFDFIQKSLFKYKFIRDRKTRKFRIQKQTFDNSSKNILNTNTIVNGESIQTRKNKQKVGCGAPMNFDTLPRLPNIEQILKDWYQCETMEQVVKKFNEDEKIEETRLKVEERVAKKLEGFKY